jgi:hypothetical protein
MAWHGMAWHRMASHGIASHRIVLHRIALYCIALYCIALHQLDHCNLYHSLSLLPPRHEPHYYKAGRVDILKVHTRKLAMGANVDLEKIGRSTPG